LLFTLLCACGGSGEPESPEGEGAAADEIPFTGERELQEVPAELIAAVERDPDDPVARRKLAIALHDAKRSAASNPSSTSRGWWS